MRRRARRWRCATAGLSGRVVLVGAETHVPYERPPLSKDAMVAGLPLSKAVAGADGLAEGIDFRRGVAAVAIERAERAVVLADGTRVAYDRLLLATGARPRMLALAGAEGPGVATLRTLDDAARIRAALGPGRRLAVVGGGFIGLELAASARKIGSEVSVLEAAPRLLGAGCRRRWRRWSPSGIGRRGWWCAAGWQVAGIGAEGVRLEGGETVAADLVVVGVGAMPNVELAEAAGLGVANGIAVDATLATDDPAILAAGDCCSFPLALYGGRRVRLESWRSAQEQGALAARNLLGANEKVSAVPWFWSDQYDLSLQVAGLAEGAETLVRREGRDGAFVLFHLAPDGRLLAASGIGPGNAVAKEIRLARDDDRAAGAAGSAGAGGPGRQPEEAAGGRGGLIRKPRKAARRARTFHVHPMYILGTSFLSLCEHAAGETANG